jgi:hypothetical protein
MPYNSKKSWILISLLFITIVCLQHLCCSPQDPLKESTEGCPHYTENTHPAFIRTELTLDRPGGDPIKVIILDPEEDVQNLRCDDCHTIGWEFTLSTFTGW